MTGKTLLAKTLARFVNVPFVIADATAITQVTMAGISCIWMFFLVCLVPLFLSMFIIVLSVTDKHQTKLIVRAAFLLVM